MSSTKNINYDEFIELINQTSKMKVEKIIQTHKSLIGNTYQGSNDMIYDCGISFVCKLLDYCWGKSIAVEMPKNYTNFFNSTYFSDYIKNFIKQNIELSTKSQTLQDIINSNRGLNSFTEEEFAQINFVLKEAGHDNLLTLLSFELNSKGAIDFLNNKVDKDVVIRRIISTSGLSTRPEFYSGRGAMWCDLNSDMLNLIYKKLTRLDSSKGLNMAKMALEMKTLGATEFLENLYLLAANDYDLEKIKLSSDNVSFGNSRGRSMYAIGLASLAALSSYSREDATPVIKDCFINMLPEETLKNIDLEKIDHGNEYDSSWEYPRVYRRHR